MNQRRRSRRAGLGGRRRARKETWAFVRRPRVGLAVLAGMALIVAVAFGGDALQQALGGRSAASWWTQFVLGLGIGGVPCLMWIAVTSADGSASWRSGAQAERWTAEEFDRLGPSWHVEHDVPIPERTYVINVDHVAIGPHGVLAVETKWTSHAVDLSAPRLATEVQTAIRQAQGNAGRVRGLIKRVSSQTEVIPVVVYLGPNVRSPGSPVRREGDVRVVAGGQGADWRSRLSQDRLDVNSVDQLAARIRDWRIEQEQKTVGVGVASRLHSADRWGRLSIGLALLMVVLLPLGRTTGPIGDFVDTMFRLGGSRRLGGWDVRLARATA